MPQDKPSHVRSDLVVELSLAMHIRWLQIVILVHWSPLYNTKAEQGDGISVSTNNSAPLISFMVIGA
jgi:hypothetical protein